MSTETQNPSQKTLARKPRGLQDRGPADIAATEAMMKVIRQVYSRYGFDALETPFFEYSDALGKFLPDQDRPNAGVFSLQDDDRQWMSLRYDLTAPLARYAAENWQNLPKPFRSYRAGWVFRNEKPGPGRFRQFMQFEADTVGASSVAADAEMCMMAADTLDSLGLFELDSNGNKRPLYFIKVNNRKVLDGVMEAIGIGRPEHAGTRLTVLRAIDKRDKFPEQEIRKLLGKEGRWDGGEIGKGDFTKGAGLDHEQVTKIMRYINFENDPSAVIPHPNQPTDEEDEDGIYFNTTTMDELLKDGTIASNKAVIGALNFHFGENQRAEEGIKELSEIADLVEVGGYSDRIRIDPSVVRGLEYYTGPVFEAELLFDTLDEDGKPIRFGSVGGGGRYDGLVSRFLDEPVPATGFSIGVSRLLAALQALGKVSTRPEPGPVIVLAMDKTPEAMASYQNLVASLRNADIRAELYLGAANMKQQLKYAGRRNSAIAIIQGSNEREKGEVQIKDLILGATLAETKDRAEYLAKQAEAQFAVPVSGLIDAVKKVLARHG